MAVAIPDFSPVSGNTLPVLSELDPPFELLGITTGVGIVEFIGFVGFVGSVGVESICHTE
ncbi:hypothetical protein LMG8520_2411 [Lactococcus lactis subsp. lactis]|uniref:Uncharacterized protein n=2 Tax=Lactococcus lactis TaxID=1358 RepID=A0A2A5SK25_LACLH|nr:hypothetical protein LMG8520_2411 [Lactococcus lactis subsp. lactis]PCS13834.1 hypothetical protein RU90_GL001799 [Lactococcus lactis subsp. hordniae]